jgi:cytochrome P450
VMESMRMFPVAGAGIGRYADRDIDLGGFHIPKGTEVAVCLHTLHNVPWNFPEPDRFYPERFDDATGPASSSGMSKRKLHMSSPCKGFFCLVQFEEQRM